MILNKEKKEVDTFLSVNNDIYRMVKALDKDDMLKKLLVNTDSKPLQGSSVEKSLIDKQITRVALLPYDDEEGSVVNITMINGTLNHNTNTFNNTLAVDVFTPGNQWIINEGVRPLMIAHAVDNFNVYINVIKNSSVPIPDNMSILYHLKTSLYCDKIDLFSKTPFSDS